MHILLAGLPSRLLVTLDATAVVRINASSGFSNLLAPPPLAPSDFVKEGSRARHELDIGATMSLKRRINSNAIKIDWG